MGHEPLERRRWEAAALPAPHFKNAHKQKLFALLDGRVSGVVGYSRWAERPLPAELPSRRPEVVVNPGVYDYAGSEGVWQVNFADPALFVAWASSLLAQDELQALEHPQL